MPSDNPTICFCMNVKKNTIVQAIENGAQSLSDVRRATRACCGCQSCYADIEELLDQYAPEIPNDSQADPKPSPETPKSSGRIP